MPWFNLWLLFSERGEAAGSWSGGAYCQSSRSQESDCCLHCQAGGRIWNTQLVSIVTHQAHASRAIATDSVCVCVHRCFMLENYAFLGQLNSFKKVGYGNLYIVCMKASWTHANSWGIAILYIVCVCVCRPSMLDNYALLSGQLNSLKQLLRGDKMPALRNFVLFPILLSQDPDPHLEVSPPCWWCWWWLW